jgi:hypothetical protein
LLALTLERRGERGEEKRREEKANEQKRREKKERERRRRNLDIDNRAIEIFQLLARNRLILQRKEKGDEGEDEEKKSTHTGAETTERTAEKKQPDSNSADTPT